MSDIKKNPDLENLEHQDDSSSSASSSASTIICTPPNEDSSLNEDNPRFSSPATSEELDDQLDVDGQDLKRYDVLQLANLDDRGADGQPRIPRMILRRTVDSDDHVQIEDDNLEEDLPNHQSWNYEYDPRSYDVINKSPYFSNPLLIMPYLRPIVLKPVVAEELQVDKDKFHKVFDLKSKVKEEPPRISSTSTMTLVMESLALLHDPYRDYHYENLEYAARLLCGPLERPEEPVPMVEVPDFVDDNDHNHHDNGDESSASITTTIVDVNEDENEEFNADKEEKDDRDDLKPVTRRRGRPAGRSLGRFHNLEKRELHSRAKKNEAVAKISKAIPPTRKYSRKDPKKIPQKKKLPQKNQEKKKTNRNQKPDFTPKQKRVRELHPRVKKDECIPPTRKYSCKDPKANPKKEKLSRIDPKESPKKDKLLRKDPMENPKKEKLPRKDPKVSPKKDKLSRKNQEKKNPTKKTTPKTKKKPNQIYGPKLSPEEERERRRTYMREYRLTRMTHAQKEKYSAHARVYYLKRKLEKNPEKFWKSIRKRPVKG